MEQLATKKISEIELHALIRRAQSGDADAECAVLECDAHIIEIIMAKTSNLQVDESARYHGAYKGLRHAIKCYNFTVPFGAYALRCAYFQALREIDTYEHVVSIPNNVTSDFRKCNKSPYQKVHLKPNGCLVKEGVKKTEDVPVAIQHFDYAAIDYKNAVSSFIGDLTELEKDAIYHMSGLSPLGLREGGEKHGISWEWFRQIEKRTVKKIRAHLERAGITRENLFGSQKEETLCHT